MTLVRKRTINENYSGRQKIATDIAAICLKVVSDKEARSKRERESSAGKRYERRNY